MFNQYFGYYLLNKGLVTPEQLSQALHYESSTRVKLGVLAVDAGLMTAVQVGEVHDLQRAKDKKFGELALEKGYLTVVQIEELLAAQAKGHLTLIQTIADKGYMVLGDIEKALAEFRVECGITAPGSASSAPIDDTEIKKLLDFSQAGDNAHVLYSYAGLTLRNMVRFLNETPFMQPEAIDAEHSSQWVASQRIIGDLNITIDLIMDEQTVLKAASRFSGEELTIIDEMALDSIGEFLNVHNGVYCSLLSTDGFKVDLQPQTVRKQKNSTETSGCPIVITTLLGRFDFRLSFKVLSKNSSTS
ncbi:chemotaxis protein CheX [Pelosinus propionicus]|uniref:Chemotaxis phosphatase CheX n=1 Tax=Pelosinus propionicus DSM 13327 TaxID=1123291 RepID=A0A1I4IDJ8_9FIRM|nr:chemotaxis protein CheX [Pelosinus propionicus]SFL51871.1 Chemotaxis phosphatase CheX [Pelosinus propionicus DSM 13327]